MAGAATDIENRAGRANKRPYQSLATDFGKKTRCACTAYDINDSHWAVDVFFFANVFTMQHLPCIHVRAHLEGITDRYAKLRYPILTPCAAAARHVPSDATPGTGITTKRDHAHARTVAALGHSGPKTRG